MGSFASEQAVLTALRQSFPFVGYKLTGGGALGNPYSIGSTWRTAGSAAWPAGGVPSTTPGDVLDRTSTGAYPLPPPITAKTRYILRTRMSGSLVGSNARTATIYDRLVQVSGISANNGNEGVAQVVNTAALPARAIPSTVCAAIEGHGTLGVTTSLTAMMTYTNEAGVSGRTSAVISIGGFTSAQMAYFPLQAGDLGVQSVQSVTLTNTTASNVTATGLIGVTLMSPILTLGIEDRNNFTHIYEADWKLTGLPVVADDACLSLAAADSSTTQDILLEMRFGYA